MRKINNKRRLKNLDQAYSWKMKRTKSQHKLIQKVIRGIILNLTQKRNHLVSNKIKNNLTKRARQICFKKGYP